jgi:hypothetical protein
MKRLLLTNWHAMRWIRLNWTVLIQQAIPTGNIRFYGCFFSIQAIFNTGCALNGCEVSTLKKIK